jgi:molybdenum cofactor cytidylyltransferase
MDMFISAIVLAAGESRRMGKTKQLLDVGGKPLLQHILDRIHQTEVDEVILVLGHEAERIQKKISPLRAKVVLNPDYRQGMITSIRQGLQALDPRSKAFFIVLGDQPGIEPGVYNLLIREFRNRFPQKTIFLPAYKGRRGHPALFSVKHRVEALRIEGDRGFRKVLEMVPQEVFQVEMESESIVNDLDTPQDYQNFIGKKDPEESV